jgi:hypothetical protein
MTDDSRLRSPASLIAHGVRVFRQLSEVLHYVTVPVDGGKRLAALVPDRWALERDLLAQPEQSAQQ